MRSTPLVMTGENVLKVLAGTKTQTRRVLNPQPVNTEGNGWSWRSRCYSTLEDIARAVGAPGDVVWIKETWFPGRGLAFAVSTSVLMSKSGAALRGGVLYRADNPTLPPGRQWRSARYMPRHLSRITRTLKLVRVERLQDLPLDDVFAELGLTKAEAIAKSESWEPYDEFADLWDSINARRPGCSWAANPYVVVRGW